MSKQHHCQFVRTKHNDKVRFNPPNPRVAICFQLHDEVQMLSQMADMSDETWVKACNQLRSTLDWAKQAKAQHTPPAKPVTP